MSPHLDIVKPREAIVFRLRGPLVLGHGAQLLRDVARRVAASGRDVALDLSRVTEMDAHGIGVIAALCAAARDAGTSIVLDGASTRVTRLLRLTHLDSFIPNFVPAASQTQTAATPARTCTVR